jgi:hypothetical protein
MQECVTFSVKEAESVAATSLSKTCLILGIYWNQWD